MCEVPKWGIWSFVQTFAGKGEILLSSDQFQRQRLVLSLMVTFLFSLAPSQGTWAAADGGGSGLQFSSPQFFLLPSCMDLLSGAVQKAPLTHYVAQGQSRVQQARQAQPDPQFVSWKQEASQPLRQGLAPSTAFSSLLTSQPGSEVSWLATPSINTEHPSEVSRFSPGLGLSTHLKLEVQPGQWTTTQLYFNRPLMTSWDQFSSEGYLFSPERGDSVLVFHVHGGGTPSAEAMNGSSIATHLAKHKIAFAAVDQHGHGKGPRYAVDNFDDLIEYNLAVIEKTTHPDVKVVLSGHSWGGEFWLYFYTQYWPRHREGRYKRVLDQIIGVMPLSPPADLAMGQGSPRERVELEEKLFRTLADDPNFMDRIADKDKQFMRNVVRSGKLNPIGTLYALWTQIHYSTPLPNSQEMDQRPRLLLIQGMWDGLTYVGREFAFEPLAELLGRDFVLMDRHDTFEGKDQPQGHQTMDALRPDGKYLVYSSIVDLIEEQMGQSFPEVNPWEALSGEDNLVPLLHKLSLLMGNNFAAREYFQDLKVVVRSPAYRTRYLARKMRDLKAFTQGLMQIREANTKAYSEAAQKEIAQLAKSYGIRDAEEGALRELDVEEPSPQRVQRLKDFIQRAQEVEKDYRRHHVFTLDEDSQFKWSKLTERADKEYSRLYAKWAEKGTDLPHSEDVASVASRIVQLEDAKQQLKGLAASKNKGTYTPHQWDLAFRDLLNEHNLHHPELIEFDHSEVILAKWIDEELQQLRKPKAFAPIQKDRNRILENLVRGYKALRTEFNRGVEEGVTLALADIDPKSGWTSLRQARWELNIDHSEERRAQLHEFLYEAAKIRSQKRAEFAAAREAEVQAYVQTHLPRIYEVEERERARGLSPRQVEEDVRRVKGEIESIEADRFVPSVQRVGTESFAAISGAVEKMVEMEREGHRLREILRQEDVDGRLKDKYDHRDRLLRKVDAFISQLMVDVGPDEWPGGQIPLWPKDIRRAVQARENKLLLLMNAEFKYMGQMTEYLLHRYEERGQLKAEDFEKMPATLMEQGEIFRVLKKEYLALKDQVTALTVEALRRGDFDNRRFPGAEKVQEHLFDLLGMTDLQDDFLIFDPDSIEGQIRELEAREQELKTQLIRAEEQMEVWKYIYSSEMSTALPGVQVNNYELVNLGQWLNKTPEQLRELTQDPRQRRLMAAALKQSLDRWEDMWREVIYENERAQPDWYPISPRYRRAATQGEL